MAERGILALSFTEVTSGWKPVARSSPGVEDSNWVRGLIKTVNPAFHELDRQALEQVLEQHMQ